MKCEKHGEFVPSQTPTLSGQLYLQGSILTGRVMELCNGTWSGLALPERLEQ